MSPARSSTSSSSDPVAEPETGSTSEARSPFASFAWVVAGACLVVLGFEIAVRVLFSVSADVAKPDGGLKQFFYYGYSLEEKLRRFVGDSGEARLPIVDAGWVQDDLRPPSPGWNESETRVLTYGMSFMNRVAERMRGPIPEASIALRAGPGAPLSHAYAMYESDPWRPEATHLVVGILSSSLPYLKATTGLGFTPEVPAPYTFPRFTAANGQLERLDPAVSRKADFMQRIRSGGPDWEAHLAFLEDHDAYWDSFLFKAGWTDQSALLRLVRRSWANRNVGRVADSIRNSDGTYRTDDPSLAAVPMLLDSMGKMAAARDQQLIVILFHGRGDERELHDWLAPELVARNIDFVSTADLFSARDAMNFLADGHYTPDLDQVVADAVREKMR